MADARLQAEWDQTAAILWLTYAAHRGPKTPMLDIADFHPYQSKRTATTKVGIEALKIFLPKDQPAHEPRHT